MILYLSKSRIENLYMEQSIKKPRVFNIFSAIKKVEVNVDKVGVSGEFDYPNNVSDNKIKDILLFLKNKKRIISIDNKKHIYSMKYYYCCGRLSTDNYFKANTQDEFQEDDVIGFNVKIPNDYYDKIHIKCSVPNLKTLCRSIKPENKWVYYIGSGPNIFFGSMEIEMIFIVESIDENSRIINGVPIIISASDEPWLKSYVCINE